MAGMFSCLRWLHVSYRIYSYYLRSRSTNIDQVVPQATQLELVEVAEFFFVDLPVLHWLDVWMELEAPAVSWNQSSRVAVNGYLNETFNIPI